MNLMPGCSPALWSIGRDLTIGRVWAGAGASTTTGSAGWVPSKLDKSLLAIKELPMLRPCVAGSGATTSTCGSTTTSTCSGAGVGSTTTGWSSTTTTGSTTTTTSTCGSSTTSWCSSTTSSWCSSTRFSASCTTYSTSTCSPYYSPSWCPDVSFIMTTWPFSITSGWSDFSVWDWIVTIPPGIPP